MFSPTTVAACRKPKKRAPKSWPLGKLGTAIVDGGAPTGQAKTVNPDGSVADGGGANPLTGYTVVTAADLDAAVALAKGCPILSTGGTIEVAETIDM